MAAALISVFWGSVLLVGAISAAAFLTAFGARL